MSNQQAYFRFMELLETQQISHDADRDIRSHVLSLTNEKVGFGYVSETMTTLFGANLTNVFPHAKAVDDPEIASADAYFALGTVYKNADKSHRGAVRLFNSAPAEREVFLCESGFLASTHSWAHSFQDRNPSYACLGFVYDDIAHYFMADYPNRIIQKLNSAEKPTEPELARAKRLISRIVQQRISKYNAQPMLAPTMTDGYKRRVMVVDQAYADASTIYGKVGDEEFERMLLAALAENPDAEILVKTHPDTTWAKNDRTGFYTHLQSQGRVRILRDPVNPYALFDLVDTVYVGTSQMGLEALFAGKKVVTFGAPFYGGWGLTDDRQKIPHRHRKRSLVELFHYFYIWYTIYNIPGKQGVAEIEEVLSFIEKNRPFALPPSKAELASPPKVSVIIPVHGVERYIEECITSIQRQTLREIEIIPVNDCSPDNSQQIIDRLAAEDPRIKPIKLKENIGQGFARNKGIDAASGDFLWFIDGDDWLPNAGMLAELLDSATQDNLDMVRAPKSFEAVFDSEDQLLFERPDGTESYFSEPVRKTDFAQSKQILHNRHFWTWLYRRTFLNENEIRFVTSQWEERAFLLKALVRAKNISLTDVAGPAYRVRVGSTARRNRGENDFKLMLTNFSSTFDWFVEQGAVSRDHPLRYHLEFQCSQYVQHMLLGGPYAFFSSQGTEAASAFLTRMRDEIVRCDFMPTDFVTRQHKLSESHLLSNAYPLMIGAILAKRPEIVALAVANSPVPQRTLYEFLLSEPQDKFEAAFEASLNLYARNSQVTRSTETPVLLPKPKPRIVIHIGATKTGSTFIQHMLESNRPALLRAGVWFPEVGLFWQPTRPHKQAGHSEFTKSVVRGDQFLRQYIERGLEIMDGRIHTIVLSSEAYFLQNSAHRLAEYFSGYRAEMIVYLRRQDEWANSQYCEFVAGGAVGRVDVPITEWLSQSNVRDRLNYAGLLAKWTKSVGQENVHVRVYDRDQFEDGDLIVDFSRTADLPQLLDMPRPDAKQQNEARLSTGHVELIRLFNQRPFLDRDSYFNFIEETGSEIAAWRQSAGIKTSKPFVLTEEKADALMVDYEVSNSEIARTYLGRKDGVLFGPRGAIPENGPIYPEEISLVESIYQKYGIKATTEAKSPSPEIKPKSDVEGAGKKLKERERVLASADAIIRQLEAERDFLKEINSRKRHRLERLAASLSKRLAGIRTRRRKT